MRSVRPDEVIPTLSPAAQAARDAARARVEAARMEQELSAARAHPTGAFTLGRRTFLRGSGGLILSLPFIEAIANPRQALAAPVAPRFFILWHQGQGTQFDQWAIPGSSPESFRLGKILEPIAPWRDRFLFFRGIDNRAGEASAGNGHTTKEVSCLTCQPNGGGPSFDQVLSRRIRTQGQRSSLNLAAGRSARIRLYAGPGDKIESQGDPRRAMSGLFTTGSNSNAELERLRARNKSVLDGVRENFATFRARLGREDRLRLDQHADKLRELEVRQTQMATASCAAPNLNLPGSFNPAVDQATSAHAQIEIIVMAFACNLTPVATLEFTDDHNPPMFGAYSRGFSDWHDMVHAGESRRGITGLHDGYRWYSERFAVLMRRLSEVQVGGQSLLDQTLVQWTADFGYGSGHNGMSVHAALAGSLGPGVRMGRLITFNDSERLWTKSDWTLNNLAVTILRAFGQSDSTFGSQGGGVRPGPIPGVLS